MVVVLACEGAFSARILGDTPLLGREPVDRFLRLSELYVERPLIWN